MINDLLTIVHEGYGLEIDLWALGVILYILLCGFPPFRSPDHRQSQLFHVIKEGSFEFLRPYFDNISKSMSTVKFSANNNRTETDRFYRKPKNYSRLVK